MKKILFLFILFFLIQYVQAQSHETDSLKNLLSLANEDTGKVTLLLNIANMYETNNQDSSNFYLTKVKELAEKLNYKNGLYKYFEHSAIVSLTKGDYALAMEQIRNALELAKEIGDSSFMINALANTGIIYQYLGKYDSQLDYSLQALALMERRHKYKKLAPMYHNIGNAYYNLSQYRKCIDYCIPTIFIGYCLYTIT